MKFKRILTGILSAAVAFSTLVIPAFATETTTTYEVTDSASLKKAMTEFTGSNAQTATIELKDNITMADGDTFDVDWSAMGITTKNLVFNGNNHTITGLKNPLIKKVDRADSITFNDVTIDKANISFTVDEVGVAAFVGESGENKKITFNNCKATNSSIKTTGDAYCGSFVGYAGNAINDFLSIITLNNCEAKNNTLECKGSVGAVVGHATGSGTTTTKFIVDNTTISDNIVTCTESGKNNKAGAVCGTIGSGNVTVVDTAVSSNTVKSDGTEIKDTIYGRQGNENGSLAIGNVTLNGSAYKDEASFVSTVAAKIGNEYYATLEDAMNSLKDRTGDIAIQLMGTVSYDYAAWNGFTKGYNGGTITFEGTAADKGTVLNLNGTDTDCTPISNEKKLIFKNLTINKTNASDNGNSAWNRHAIYFKGGVDFEDVTVNTLVAIGGGSSFKNVIFNEKNEQYCLWIQACTDEEIIVESCTFNANSNNGRGIKIADEYQENNRKTVNLTLTNSTFTTAQKAAVLVSSTTGANITASENNITNVAADSGHLVWFDDKLVYAGSKEYIVVRDTNGKILTEALSGEDKITITKTAVAKIGEVEYTSLASAIAAAKDGDTVTLVKDASGEGIGIKDDVFGANGLTIDLNNHTYTVEKDLVGSPNTKTNAYWFCKGNKITIKNGILSSSAEVERKQGECSTPGKGAYMLIQNHSTALNLENVILDGTNLASYAGTGRDDIPYTISNDNGNVEIKNSQVISVKGYAFDVDNNSSYDGVTVNVTNSNIVGLVNVTGNTADSTRAYLKIGGKTYAENSTYVQYNNEFVKKSTDTTATGLFEKVLLITNMDIKTVESKGDYYPLDVYTAIDSLNYKEVGFKVRAVTSKGNVYAQKETTVVYEKMIVTKTDGQTAEYGPSDFGFDNGYLFGQEVLLFTSDFTNADTDFYVTPYAIKTDGTIITGAEQVAGKSTNTTLFKEMQNN